MEKIVNKVKRILLSRRAVIAYIIIGAVFVTANGVVWAMYRNKTYPGTNVAYREIGSVPFNELESRIRDAQLLPDEVSLSFRDKQTKVRADELGIGVNHAGTAERIKQSRSWLPILNMLSVNEISFDTKVDNAKLDRFVKKYAAQVAKKPKDASIALKDGAFSISSDSPGYSLNPDYARSEILDYFAAGAEQITLQPETTPAKVSADSLKAKLDTLNKQRATAVTLKFGNKSKSFTPAEIAVMFDVEEGHAELADANIQAAVIRTGQGFGILVKNTAAAVAAIKQAVTDVKPLEFTLIEQPKPTLNYTYCVAAKGVSSSYLGGFAAKLAAVFSDSRGWGLNGQVTFSKVSSGCDFTAWLSAASQMPTFGAICDSTWSCRVGPNVVINFDRWQNASPAWNKNGGTLDNYRSMVINHETGHWFGYYHASCGGAGQLAPVMQQQSIDLQGCKFNPWPTSGELAMHRRTLGL